MCMHQDGVTDTDVEKMQLFFIHLQQKSHLLAWLQELAFSSRNQVTVKSLSNPVT